MICCVTFTADTAELSHIHHQRTSPARERQPENSAQEQPGATAAGPDLISADNETEKRQSSRGEFKRMDNVTWLYSCYLNCVLHFSTVDTPEAAVEFCTWRHDVRQEGRFMRRREKVRRKEKRVNEGGKEYGLHR